MRKQIWAMDINILKPTMKDFYADRTPCGSKHWHGVVMLNQRLGAHT